MRIKKFTNNKHVHFTDMNIGVFHTKITLAGIKEYYLKDSSVTLPGVIPLKEVLDFYIENRVQQQKK